MKNKVQNFRKKIKKTVKRIANNLKTKGLYETISWELYNGQRMLYI